MPAGPKATGQPGQENSSQGSFPGTTVVRTHPLWLRHSAGVSCSSLVPGQSHQEHQQAGFVKSHS